jgi:hypothetical protein
VAVLVGVARDSVFDSVLDAFADVVFLVAKVAGGFANLVIEASARIAAGLIGGLDLVPVVGRVVRDWGRGGVSHEELLRSSETLGYPGRGLIKLI